MLDGTYGRWSEFHERPRYRCYPDLWRDPANRPDGARAKVSHVFTPTMPARHPTSAHPHHGESCPHCEHVLASHEGPRTANDFLFTVAEIAKALVLVGQGNFYRQVARIVRLDAQRTRVDPRNEASIRRREKRIAKGLPVRRYRVERDGIEALLKSVQEKRYESETEEGKALEKAADDRYSKEARLVTAWIDHFAPVILAKKARTRWPKWVGLDSMPMRLPAVDKNGKPKKGGRAAGEILIATDLTRRPAEPILARVAGGRDALSWADFMRSLAGAPQLVVSDRAGDILAAMQETWPEAVHYACEGHLLKNAHDAARKDGIHELAPCQKHRPGSTVKPLTGKRRKPLPINERDHAPVHCVHAAIETMTYDAEHWEALKDVIADHVDEHRNKPNGFLHLANWVRVQDTFMAEHLAFRAEHWGYPRGAGVLETLITTKIGRSLKYRAYALRNRSRLDKALGLMILDHRNQASEVDYAAILRKHIAEKGGGHVRADWHRDLDSEDDPPSIDLLIWQADRRLAKARTAKRDAKRAARAAAAAVAVEEERKAAGLPPVPKGPRGKPREERPKGQSIADYPELVASWHPTENGDLRPDDVTPGSNKLIAWLCRAHEHDPVPHLHEWASPARYRVRNPGCTYCDGNSACPSNSLRAVFPVIAGEWHPTKNGERTPDDFKAKSNKEAWWLCSVCGREWPAPIDRRTVSHSGCPDQGRHEERPAPLRPITDARRAYLARVDREQRAIAREPDDEDAGGEDPDDPWTADLPF